MLKNKGLAEGEGFSGRKIKWVKASNILFLKKHQESPNKLTHRLDALYSKQGPKDHRSSAL